MSTNAKIFNTRIQNKRDEYSAWVAKDPVLLNGEICTVIIPAETGAMVQEPAVMMKVGDGTSKWSALPWLGGLSHDVYQWAKAADKPSYSAGEITGIDAYIANYVNDQMGISVDTDTQYQMVKVDDYNYKLQSKGKADSAWADVANGAIVIPKYDDTAVTGRVTDLETKVGNDTVSNQIDAKLNAYKATNDAAVKAAQDDVDALGVKVGTVPDGKTIVEMISDAQTAATYDDAEVRGLIGDNADDISEISGKVTTLVGDDTGKSVRTIANEELAAQLIGDDAKESLDTLEEIAAWIQSHPDDASAMNAAIVALQAKVDTGDKTVTAYVTDAIAALSIGDYALAADLTALAGRVAELESKKHEHSNKALLDTYTQTEANLADAVAKKHTHTFNEAELNKIAEGDVAKWNAAQANAEAAAASALASAKTELQGNIDKKANTADLHAIATSGNVDDLAQTDGTYFILNCGTSSVCI